MTDPLPVTAPNVICPVCLIPPGRPCIALDGQPVPGGHPERDETTPAADAAMAALADPWGTAIAALHEVQQGLTGAIASLESLMAAASPEGMD